MRDISKLHPRLIEKVEMLKLACQINGLEIGIGECVRTKSEQDELYKKGRTLPGKIVTNAKGSTYSSMHQWGVAFDFYRNDGKDAFANCDGFFDSVGEIGKSLGLMWGGDWKNPVDKPHFQLPDWGKTASALKSKYKTPEKFMKSWETEEMTTEEKARFGELEKKVQELENSREKVYHYTSELPHWAKPTIQKLMDKGIYAGASEDDLNLPESIMRNLVINDRAKLYK